MKRVFLVIVSIGSMAAVAAADLASGSQTVAILGGLGGSSSQYDFQPGRRRTVTGGGGALGAQYFYYIKSIPAIAVGADLASSSNGNLRATDILTGYDTTGRLKSVVGMVMARLAYPRGRWRPYAFAGLGVHDSTLQLSARPISGNAWPGGGTESRMLIDEHTTSAAVGYGIGVDFFASEAFFVGAEMRTTWLGGMDTDNTAGTRAAGFGVAEKQGVGQGNLFLRVGTKF